MNFKLGFIGVGVMAGGILNTIINNINILPIKLTQIAIYDIDKDKLLTYEKLGIKIADDFDYILNNCEFVLLGVKPQTFFDSINTGKSIKAKIIISIMAGINIDYLIKVFGIPNFRGFVRMMPNLPCTIGEGVIGIFGYNIINADYNWIKQIFSSCGKLVDITEDKFDALTSISGSGPAYVFYFIQSMINSGIKEGLSEEESKTLVLNTISGSISFAKSSTMSIKDLINNVCSKGGTTIEAIKVFDEKQLEIIIAEAIHACKNKSEILSRNE